MRTIKVIAMMMAAMAAMVAPAGDSAPFRLDTRIEPVEESSIDVTWNASWIGGDACATVVIADNGTEVNRATGAGEFLYTPSAIGRHELTYTTYIDGIAQDEIYCAVVFTAVLGCNHLTVDVGEKGTVEESGGGYVVEAKEGETLTEADFSFGVAKEAYVVSIAAGGKSATVALKAPEVRRVRDNAPYQGGGIEEDVGEDAEDSAGVLASAEDVVAKHGEGAIKAKPTPKSGETVGALPVKTYEGLYYQAAWGDDLGTMTQGEKVQATGDMLYLGVIKQKGGKGFYKIIVSEQ